MSEHPTKENATGNSEDGEASDYIFKIIAIGDAAVGKTSLTYRYATNRFEDDYRLTLGMNLITKNIDLSHNGEELSIQLSIWDTGGQSSFAPLLPMYYRGALGALIVYDLTNKDSFDSIDKWVSDVRKHCEEIPIVLIGNKNDLTDQIVVSREEGEKKSEKIKENWDKPIFFFETSAKEDVKVNESFVTLARSILQMVEKQEDVDSPDFDTDISEI